MRENAIPWEVMPIYQVLITFPTEMPVLDVAVSRVFDYSARLFFA